MRKYENDRRRKVNEIVAVVKLLSIFFCGIVVLSLYSHYTVGQIFKLYSDKSRVSIVLSFICIAVLVLSYEAWIFSTRKSSSDARTKAAGIIETAVFMAAFSALIILTGSHASPYKFLFLFIIITSAIEFGMAYGVSTALAASGFILIMDIVSMPFNSINKCFETDLILAGAFILTAWLLGHYVRVEEEHRELITGLANQDELTGVYNHRFFQDFLKHQIEACKSSGGSVSLLFIDIDNFKNYNDLFGHLAGDRILKEIGSILKRNVRPDDVVARYGGEEFAVILPKTNESQAVSIAERIRRAVENTDFEGAEQQPGGRITISIGISCFPEKAKTKTELISSADDALYRAKFFSKNRVETYYSILEELKTYIDEEHIDLISSIKTLISVINAKDHYTYAHTERVVGFCRMIGEKLNIPEDDMRILRYGAYLHDIGKIQLPKEALNKRGPLTEEEWDLFRQHPVNGAEIIKPVKSLKDVVPLILHHHERYDGGGYPGKLKGESIPYLARILTVADSFDAMTSNRPYKPRKTCSEAILELKSCSGTQFDPDIVNSFIEVLKENRDCLDTL